MVTCPNCGNPVREIQQFCGNCGTDVHAALAAAANAAPVEEEPTSTPYAYSQPTGYGYDYQTPAQPASNRLVVIGIAVVLIACLMFCCGLVFGFEIIPDLLGIGGGAAVPKTTPTPTPAGLLPIIHYFIG